MNSCLKCGGTGRLVNGDICPDCGRQSTARPIAGIPIQYQGVRFDASHFQNSSLRGYGQFMEELLNTILNDYAYYQKNCLICSKPGSGKTIWAYTLYQELYGKGCVIPPLRDVAEVRDIMNSYSNRDEANLYSTARCVIIKIPRDLQPWLFDTISMIIERRVRYSGFTILLYGGSYNDLEYADKYGRLKEIVGNGSFNTIKVYDYGKKVKDYESL